MTDFVLSNFYKHGIVKTLIYSLVLRLVLHMHLSSHSFLLRGSNYNLNCIDKVWPYEETDEYGFVQGLFGMIISLFSRDPDIFSSLQSTRSEVIYYCHPSSVYIFMKDVYMFNYSLGFSTNVSESAEG